jgi:hypothetical protein
MQFETVLTQCMFFCGLYLAKYHVDCTFAGVKIKAIFGIGVQWSNIWSIVSSPFDGVTSMLASSVPSEWNVYKFPLLST